MLNHPEQRPEAECGQGDQNDHLLEVEDERVQEGGGWEILCVCVCVCKKQQNLIINSHSSSFQGIGKCNEMAQLMLIHVGELYCN